MAGSYEHVVNDAGELRTHSFENMIDNLGDAYEAIEEMYGMIWWLASGDPRGIDPTELVRLAQENYKIGLDQAPGAEPERRWA